MSEAQNMSISAYIVSTLDNPGHLDNPWWLSDPPEATKTTGLPEPEAPIPPPAPTAAVDPGEIPAADPGVVDPAAPAPEVAFACDRCGCCQYIDTPIHDGQSLRRDCFRCGRTAAFPVWYGVSDPRAFQVQEATP